MVGNRDNERACGMLDVVKYLESLQWDGKPRIATFFDDYATGANEFDATKWFVSAVARAMRPGCEIAQHLVLCGPQGSGKSKLLWTLFGEHPKSGGYADEMSKCWIVEVAFYRVIHNKAFLNASKDTYHLPYEVGLETSNRTCVIVATDENTKSVTKTIVQGSRHFWPVTITACASRSIEGDRDQLWAEAKHHFDNGAQWWD